MNDNIRFIWKQSVTGLLENFPSQQKQAKREALLPYYCFTMYRWHKISFVREQCSLSICSH